MSQYVDILSWHDDTMLENESIILLCYNKEFSSYPLIATNEIFHCYHVTTFMCHTASKYRPNLNNLLYVPLSLPIDMKNGIEQRKQTLEKMMEKERPFLSQGIVPGRHMTLTDHYNYSESRF